MSTRLAVIRTPDQRVRVFVSSTLQELAGERAAAREATFICSLFKNDRESLELLAGEVMPHFT